MTKSWITQRYIFFLSKLLCGGREKKRKGTGRDLKGKARKRRKPSRPRSGVGSDGEMSSGHFSRTY